MTASSRDSLVTAIAGVVTDLDLPSTLHHIIESAMALTDASYGALGIIGTDGRLSDFVHVGMSPEDTERVGSLPEGRGILGLLGAHPHALRLADLTTHPSSVGFPAHHPPMTTFLGVPIRVGDEVFGNLYLTEKRGGDAFTPEDEELVVALSVAAGAAIANARLFERTRQREMWQRAVMEIDSAVLSGADPIDAMRVIAAQARSLADADVAVIALTEASGPLRVEILDIRDRSAQAAAHPLSGMRGARTRAQISQESVREWLHAQVPAPSPTAQAFRSGRVVEGEGIGPLGPQDQMGYSMSIPLRTPDQVLGALTLIRVEGEPQFSVEAREMAQIFATQASITLVLAQERRERERLAIFEDRDRIARDLHDLVIQRLFATGMLLQGAQRMADLRPEVSSRLSRAVDELDATVKEIRQTIFALHEDPLSGAGLRSRIGLEVRTAQTSGGVPISLATEGPVDTVVGPELQEQAVAVARELLTNAVRHARASRIDVLITAGVELVLSVSDDGVGLPEDVRQGMRKSGMRNVAERAENLGGSFDIVDRDRGTTFVWRVPLSV